MKIITDPQLRREIFDTYFAYYEAYANRRWREMTTFFSDAITMFGTGIDEVSHAGHTTLANLRREFSQAPEPITYQVKSKEVYTLSEGVVLLMLTMDVTLQNKVQEVVCPDNRTTAVMVKESEGWKLAHGHWSQPDKDIGPGECVPYRLLLDRSRQLEEKVVQRTREICTQRDELKRLNETKNKLFSVIAHDLKSPFNSIIGFSEFLMKNLEEFPPDRIREMLDIIHQQSKSTHSLLEHLLEWARSQTESITFRPETIHFRALLRKVMTSLEAPARDKEINFRCEIDENIRVKADKSMLQIILRNLLHNAIKFSYTGGEIRCRASLRGGNVIISIADDGVGMDNSSREKVQNGVQCEITTGTANENGTGLGLILCREYIARHGSRLSVDSEPGKGSCFSFTLPVSRP
ncbi:MAG: ATP-binding protein [Bacteroidales bacterium]